MKGHSIPYKIRRLHEYTTVTQDANIRRSRVKSTERCTELSLNLLCKPKVVSKQNKNVYN